MPRRSRQQMDSMVSDEEELYDEQAFRNNQRYRARAPINDDGLRVVKKSELKSVMKSKVDIYNILAKEGQLYLPPYSECSMQFINDIMMAKKKVGTSLYSLTNRFPLDLQKR